MKNNKRGLSCNTVQSKPEAWVAVSQNRQKIYGTDNDLVYLDDEQEFQIELFNPTQISYLAKIYLNEKLISNSGLVIKPGQRYFLDRHIDEKKKLLFSTYEVDDNPEVKEAIRNNGKIKVEFYPEVFINSFMGSSTTYVPYNHQWNGNMIPTNPITWATTFGSLSTGASYMSTGTAYYSASNVNSTFTSSNPDGLVFNSKTGEIKSSVAGSIPTETGRIEKGERSGQTFGSDYGTYSSLWTYVSEYQILPRSTKPVEVSEIRSYCTGCGTRIKRKAWQFCPTCGESLD
jgi:hypothetical protein